jgi:hypothetical protein
VNLQSKKAALNPLSNNAAFIPLAALRTKPASLRQIEAILAAC